MDTPTPTGIVGTHAAAETEGTSLRKEMHKKSSGLRNSLIILVLLGAAVYGGYQVFPSSASEGGSTLSLGGRLLIAAGILLLAPAIDRLFHLLGLSKAKGDLTPLILAAGAIALIFFLATSGLGQWASRSIDWVDTCLKEQDCGARADDIPVINGGSVTLSRGESETFYAIGTIRVHNNNLGTCIDVQPRGAFDLDFRDGGRILFMSSFSGAKELATVSSLPRSDCTSSKRKKST